LLSSASLVYRPPDYSVRDMTHLTALHTSSCLAYLHQVSQAHIESAMARLNKDTIINQSSAFSEYHHLPSLV